MIYTSGYIVVYTVHVTFDSVYSFLPRIGILCYVVLAVIFTFIIHAECGLSSVLIIAQCATNTFLAVPRRTVSIIGHATPSVSYFVCEKRASPNYLPPINECVIHFRSVHHGNMQDFLQCNIIYVELAFHYSYYGYWCTFAERAVL